MKGEQKSQFPYLATIRGAKLAAGDYEARAIVRQGRNVLSRGVRFRVEGEGTAGQAAPPPVAGDAPAAAAPADDDSSPVILPPVDAAELDRSGPALPAEEAARYWEESALKVRDSSERLPSFRCVQETRRLSAPARDATDFKERDVFIHEVTYENGQESYRTVSINGLKADGHKGLVEGVKSSGEFGTMLRSIFSQNVAAEYKWAGRAMAGGTLCRVFDVEVPKERSNFVMAHNGLQEIAGYQGRVYIDEETALVRRITIQGEGPPKKFGLQSPSMTLDYGLVKIGDTDYLLPLRSVLQARQGRSVMRNETIFRDYHKFEAKSSIVFEETGVKK